MIFFVVINTAIATVAIILGAIVLNNGPRNVTYQSFFIFTAGLALSAAAKPFFQEDQNFLVFLLMWWGFEIMVLGVFSLARVAADGTLDKYSVRLLAPWLLLFVSMPLLLIAAAFRPDPDAFFWQAYHDIFPFFAVLMIAHLVISLFSCLRRRTATFDLPPYLVRNLLSVVTLGACIICFSDLILPAFGVYRFSTTSNFLALIILVIGGFGIAHYGIGRGSIILRRGIPYFLSLIFVAVIFFGVEFGIEKFFYHNDRIVDVVAAVVGVLAFYPFRDFFDRITNRLFFRNSYHFLAAVRGLGERLSAPLDRDALLLTIAEFLQLTIRPSKILFFGTNEEETEADFISGSAVTDDAASDYGALASLVLRSAGSDITIFGATEFFCVDRAFSKDNARGLIKEYAGRLGVAAIVPVVIRQKIKVIMMVGHKCSGALLNKDDQEFLGFIARRAAIAFENMGLRELMERQAKKFEERVAERTERLKDMYKLQSKFLADVSHEFKTPLAILKMHAGCFASCKDHEQKKAWYVMDATIDRLSRLVSNLLDVTKKCSSCGGLRKSILLVEDLLRETYDDCMMLAQDKGVDFRISTCKISILGEKDKLKEVILNLLSNALRHTSAGESIMLMAREFDGEAEIAVRDTGSGISQEHLPHIFERFYRIEGSSATGTGIGLYLCRQIVEEHGGTITAESRIGGGSSFIIRLPISPRDA